MVIPLDPVIIQIIGRETSSEIGQLFKEFDLVLIYKSMCGNEPG